MRRVSRRALAAGLVTALTAGLGAPAFAVSLTYVMRGTCASDCNAGASVSGLLTLDRPAGSGTTIGSAEFTGLSFSIDGGPTLRQRYSSAVGIWGEQASYIDTLQFFAGSVVAPAQGWAATADLNGAEGLLGGPSAISSAAPASTPPVRRSRAPPRRRRVSRCWSRRRRARRCRCRRASASRWPEPAHSSASRACAAGERRRRAAEASEACPGRS